ncbi:MAG TPA: hypothetical protein IAB12_06230 [Candidatus Ornithospirochaeta avicola]|uniref:Uridine kinase n=1 Tax=Candidatus Ornithospirochaeta avicola TaxID=2840896 RepID=A0A9D1PUX8_9SPIO|nr:hypothetical protein [Candidatus Ornithospirochaeta avicola]
MIEEIINAVSSLLERKGMAVAAIDGKSGCGKTTLAKKLEDILSADIIHMDDFFIPIKERKAENFTVAGNFLDKKRFLSEVVSQINLPSFEYSVFDCRSQCIKEKKLIKSRIRIVEGVYALNPEFRHAYNLKYILKSDVGKRLERIEKRTSPQIFEQYISLYIPLEDMYFSAFDFSDCLVIEN